MELIFINSLASAGLEFIFSSVAVTVALLIQLRFAVRTTAESPADMVVFIFNWLFLDLAPKVQLMSMPQRLINTSTVAVDRVALTNLVCALFMIAFTLFYGFLSKRGESAPPVEAVPRVDAARTTSPQEFTGGGVGLALIVCFCVVALLAPSAYRSIEDAVAASPASLIIKRCLLFLPSATLLILLHETVRSGRKLMFSRIGVLLLLLMLVLITENPYTEKRNALGPLYVALLLIAFPKVFSTWTKRMLLLVGGMVLIFPAITIFTHNHQQAVSDVSLAQISDAIVDHYFSINYDSWANIYTAVEIVKVHGMQWGHQLAGSLLFFVPSAVWSTKPLATGIFLADYLIANYSMWFTNLSAPLVAEGYLDFGPIGVIAYAGAAAWVVTLLNRMARRGTKWIWYPTAVYGAVFLMIVLRGSLMIALGFASAAVLAFGLAAAMLSVRLGVRHRVARRVVAQPTMVS
ncbi:MAG TPA: hypothetical protein VHS76_14470 [Steroidobacteraceae bacterium]|jgi:hypothetical protein|nr:hypothetical protein [Steroidobacteraceae bacterium]